MEKETKIEIAPIKTEKKLKWDEASKYCKTLGKGWRLPTKDELNFIYKSKNSDFTDDYYWTSTEKKELNMVWSQYFKTGYQGIIAKTSKEKIRAVRDIEK
jgi:formylglycine-generating enzyme required for sulfatase activity